MIYLQRRKLIASASVSLLPISALAAIIPLDTEDGVDAAEVRKIAKFSEGLAVDLQGNAPNFRFLIAVDSSEIKPTIAHMKEQKILNSDIPLEDFLSRPLRTASIVGLKASYISFDYIMKIRKAETASVLAVVITKDDKTQDKVHRMFSFSWDRKKYESSDWGKFNPEDFAKTSDFETGVWFANHMKQEPDFNHKNQ